MIDHEGIVYPFGMTAVNITVTCDIIMLLDLACGEARFGVIEILGPVDVSVAVAEPVAYPVLVVVIVAIELVLAATPVTVTKPEPLIATAPDVTELPHMYKVLLLLML